LAVLLCILKIIGITVLIIVCLILFLIALVLFVPIRYKLTFNKKDSIDDMAGKVTVSWLLHILHISLTYLNKDLIARIRVFGIRIKQMSLLKKTDAVNAPYSNKKITNKKNKDSEDKAEEPKSLGEVYSIESEDFKFESVEDDSNEDTTNNLEEAQSENSDDIVDETDSGDDNSKKSISERIKSFINALKVLLTKAYDKFNDFFENTENRIDKINNSIDNLNKEYRFYEKFIQDEHNKAALINCLKQLKRILKSIRPRKIKGSMKFGMDDPAATGQILSIISVIYPFIYKKLLIEADFENAVIEGDILIKGKIAVIVLVVAAWKVYFNKDLKRLLRIYKKHKNRDLITKEDKK